MPASRNLENILHYIMNEAGPEELNVIRSALDRRGGVQTPQHLNELKFSEMAQKLTKDMGDRFATPMNDQVHQMTRRLVKNMIRENEPEMPEEHLNLLLDQYVPGAGGQPGGGPPGGREAEMPKDVLESMVDQFISYSLGRMPEDQDQALRREMPEWPSAYWEIFSQPTKKLIANFLKGNIDSQEFWRAFDARGG